MYQNQQPAFTFEAYGKVHAIGPRTLDVFEKHILALKPGTSEYLHENAGCINEYLLRLTSIVDAAHRGGSSSGFTLEKNLTTGEGMEDVEVDRRIALSTSLEGIARDLESKEKFVGVRESCIQVFGRQVMQELEESLGIDSRGLDAGEYLFPRTTSRMIAAVATYKDIAFSIRKQVATFRERLKQFPQRYPVHEPNHLRKTP